MSRKSKSETPFWGYPDTLLVSQSYDMVKKAQGLLSESNLVAMEELMKEYIDSEGVKISDSHTVSNDINTYDKSFG